MKTKYNYENNNGKEYYCTPLQWNYWNRKAIAEHKKKMEKWTGEMFSTKTGVEEWLKNFPHKGGEKKCLIIKELKNLRKKM